MTNLKGASFEYVDFERGGTLVSELSYHMQPSARESVLRDLRARYGPELRRGR